MLVRGYLISIAYCPFFSYYPVFYSFFVIEFKVFNSIVQKMCER